MRTAGDPTVFVIDDDDLDSCGHPRHAEIGGVKAETFGTAHEFLRRQASGWTKLPCFGCGDFRG